MYHQQYDITSLIRFLKASQIENKTRSSLMKLWFSQEKIAFWRFEKPFQSIDQIWIENFTPSMSISQKPHKIQGLTFMLKDDKPSHIPVREKCGVIIKLRSPKSVEDSRPFCSKANFSSSFHKDLRKYLITIYGIQKKKYKFQWSEGC